MIKPITTWSLAFSRASNASRLPVFTSSSHWLMMSTFAPIVENCSVISIFFKSLLRFSRLNFTALKLNGTHIGNLAMSRNWTTFLTILGELETLIWHISSFNSSQQRSQNREGFLSHSLDSEQYWIELCSFSKAKGRHLWWFFSSRSHASIVIDTTTKISQDALMWTYFLDKPLKKSTFNLCAPN